MPVQNTRNLRAVRLRLEAPARNRGGGGARLGAARAALTDGDWSGALVAAESSLRLSRTSDSAQLAFIAAAANGDTVRALRWRERAAEQ